MRTNDFVCRRCGACCRIPNGIVRVSDAEIARIAAFLGMTEADFIERGTELAPDRRGLVLKSRPDGACEWLTDDNLCRINPVKPDKCRTFPQEWTNSDSRDICPGLAACFDERKVFDAIPEQFERWRLKYTPELFEFLVSRCSLGKGTRCLEIGPGTGQATDFALDAGCDYTAIELGGHLASVMREKYGGRPNFKLIEGDFELHPFESGSFDFVYSAAAIQWIDPTIAFSKCFDILKPGRYLAMFLLHGDYQTPNPALYREIQKVYDEHFHTEAPYRRRFPYLDAPKYGFGTEERFSFPSSRSYTADEYVEYIHTHSDHIMLREDCRKAFYGGIRDAILRHGNRIEFRDEFILYLCRKPMTVRRILFVCHGNICRSPMAEFMMKELLRRVGRDDIKVESAALHTDEIGNDIHRGTRAKLREMGIPFAPRAAWLLTAEKAHGYDLLVGMDDHNIADLKRLVHPEDHSKIRALLSFAGERRSIADPWYTGDFDATYDDIVKGCTALLGTLQ